MRIQVSDGTSSSEPVAVDLDVYQTNDWPSLSVSGDTAIAEHTPLTLSLTATDPDGDELSFSASG